MRNNIIRKKNLIYIIAILLGIVEKISQVLLFAIPFKAVAIVNSGKISKLVSKPLSYFDININTNKDQFISLTIVLVLLIIHICLTKFLKSQIIKNIKIRKFNNMKAEKVNLNKKLFDKNLWKIEEFINFRTILIYSFILLIFLFYYDYQITIIIISSCIFNYHLSKKFINFDKKNREKSLNNEFKKTYINKIKNNYELVTYIKPIVNTIIMFGIMLSIFLRENASISIILLFIIRNTLNQINELILKISRNKEFIKTVFSKKSDKSTLNKLNL